MVLVSPHHWAQQMLDGTELMSDGNNTILTIQGYRKNILYSVQSNIPQFRSTPRPLFYQYLTEMVEHGSTRSKTLLRSEHIVTDAESSSSEIFSEGVTGKHNGYDSDKELSMSDQEKVN